MKPGYKTLAIYLDILKKGKLENGKKIDFNFLRIVLFQIDECTKRTEANSVEESGILKLANVWLNIRSRELIGSKTFTADLSEFDLSSNDKRFLRSLRIASDEPKKDGPP